MATSCDSMRLRQLPLAPRIVIAAFLISVGFGYFSALVQLHFSHASPGQVMPGLKETIHAYHGPTDKPMSTIERLLEAEPDKKFNGQGTMQPAFTTRSDGWTKTIKKVGDDPAKLEALRHERDGERLALLEWVRSGAKKSEYDKDDFVLPVRLLSHSITHEFLVKDSKELPIEPHRVLIKTLIEKRCADCHSADGRDAAATNFPLDTYDRLKPYVKVDSGGGMSLNKLAQSTHVHLLGFSMLYGLTGLIFAFTSFPCWLRVILGPFTLIAQVVDISMWWLARYDPIYAQAIAVTGGLVAIGLFLQIILSLFDMFNRAGRVVLVFLIVLVAGLGVGLKLKVIDPHLEKERLNAVSTE